MKIAGLALAAGAGFFVVKARALHDLMDKAAFPHYPVMAIILGITIFIISFMGCCGAIRENNCILGMVG